jgi:N-ethylmaleimide reductase
MWTDLGLQDFSVPKEMTEQDILHAKTEYVAAMPYLGFDGVELQPTGIC